MDGDADEADGDADGDAANVELQTCMGVEHEPDGGEEADSEANRADGDSEAKKRTETKRKAAYQPFPFL
jgi:hypothetical protein